MFSSFKLSIIIATYNAERYISTCIDSILKVKTDSVELIIVDGASTDSTIEIVNGYKDSVNYFLSEPDKGIYDAWNKAVRIAKGEWIAFIGSDDTLVPNSLDSILESLQSISDNIDFVFSKAEIVSSSNQFIGFRGNEFIFDEFKKGMTISHVFALHKKSVFQKQGLVDLRYRICADYEFLLRYKNHLNSIFLPIVSVKMMIGGMSFSTRAIKESFQIRRKFKYNPLTNDILYSLIAYLGYIRIKIKMILLNEK